MFLNVGSGYCRTYKIDVHLITSGNFVLPGQKGCQLPTLLGLPLTPLFLVPDRLSVMYGPKTKCTLKTETLLRGQLGIVQHGAVQFFASRLTNHTV